MNCLLCLSVDGKLQELKGDEENDKLKKITFVLPKFEILESKNPLYICASCLEQVLFFHTIKIASIKNLCLLKQFKSVLNGSNNLKSSELKIIFKGNESSTLRKNHIEIKVYSDSKDPLSLEDQDTLVHIKEEYEEHEQYRPQFVNIKSSLEDLQDGDTSNNCNNNTQQHENVGSYEFVDVNKLTKKDSNIKYNNSHNEEPKTQRGRKRQRFKSVDTHSRKKPHQCDICHKIFSCHSKLKDHSRTHTGEKPYKCPMCHKSYARTGDLTIHKHTHTGEKPHECEVCQKTFISRSCLSSHMLVHVRKRPFKCLICQQAFKTLSNLTRHNLIHSGDRSHECNTCHKTFTRSCSLLRHYKRNICHKHVIKSEMK